MKINTYLIQFALTIILIFGGTLLLKYIKTSEIYIDHLIATIIGGIILISSILWRIREKHSWKSYEDKVYQSFGTGELIWKNIMEKDRLQS